MTRPTTPCGGSRPGRVEGPRRVSDTILRWWSLCVWGISSANGAVWRVAPGEAPLSSSNSRTSSYESSNSCTRAQTLVREFGLYINVHQEWRVAPGQARGASSGSARFRVLRTRYRGRGGGVSSPGRRPRVAHGPRAAPGERAWTDPCTDIPSGGGRGGGCLEGTCEQRQAADDAAAGGGGPRRCQRRVGARSRARRAERGAAGRAGAPAAGAHWIWIYIFMIYMSLYHIFVS